MSPEAQRYLAEQVSFMRQTRAHGMARDHANTALAHFGTGLRALLAVGAVTQEEFDDWMARAREAFEPDPVATLRARGEGNAASPAATCSTSGAMPQFVRLVPAPDEEYDYHGGRLRILSVELYDTEMALNWRMAPVPEFDATFPDEAAAAERDTAGLPEEERAKFRERRRRHSWHMLANFEVTDDLGYPYQALGSWASWGNVAVGRVNITPALHQGATALVVDALGVRITVPVDSS